MKLVFVTPEEVRAQRNAPALTLAQVNKYYGYYGFKVEEFTEAQYTGGETWYRARKGTRKHIEKTLLEMVAWIDNELD